MIFAVQSQIAGGTGFLAAGYGRRQGRDDDLVGCTQWPRAALLRMCDNSRAARQLRTREYPLKPPVRTMR
jgi:hypothetical protein